MKVLGARAVDQQDRRLATRARRLWRPLSLGFVSIRWRLAIWIALSLALTLVAIFLTLRFAMAGTLTGDIDADLSESLQQVSAQVAIIGSLEDRTNLQDVVDSYSRAGLPSSFVVVIRDTHGAVRASSSAINPEALALDPEELQEVLAGDSIIRKVQLTDGEDLRVRSDRLTVGQELIGVVQVGASTEVVSRTLSRLQTIMLIGGAGAAVLALVIGYWLSRGALRPLERVVKVAAEIEASDLSKRIGAKGEPGEVQRLADTFDAMLERLGRAFEQQRDFVLDVSHELRTPLTALRGNLDVLLMDRWMDPEVRNNLQRMSGEVGRLIRLVSNLLYLAQADTGREPHRHPIELDLVCLEVYSQTKGLRPEITVKLGHEDQVTVEGDRDLIKQMILNLIDNSLKYTPAGGKVTVSLGRDGADARIVVEDTGRGIPPEELPHLFERFYRGPSTAAGGTGGAGIGLSIADWIARAHGGEISVESYPGKGSRFIIRLPLAPEPRASER